MTDPTLEPESITVSADPQYSSVQNVGINSSFSFQFVYSSGTGTATLQYSNDGTNFDDAPNMTATLSGTDSAFFAPPVRAVAYARLRFDTATGTTGSLILYNKSKQG